MGEKRVLPADVYDALAMSAEAFGGIGRDVFFSSCGDPVCAYGHAQAAEFGTTHLHGNGVLWNALAAAGIGSIENDRAVASINYRKPAATWTRVSFADWAKELNVVRGE